MESEAVLLSHLEIGHPLDSSEQPRSRSGHIAGRCFCWICPCVSRRVMAICSVATFLTGACVCIIGTYAVPAAQKTSNWTDESFGVACAGLALMILGVINYQFNPVNRYRELIPC